MTEILLLAVSGEEKDSGHDAGGQTGRAHDAGGQTGRAHDGTQS